MAVSLKTDDAKKREIVEIIILCLLALAVCALNISLIFDNVVSGDEAYTMTTVRDVDNAGIIERTYYWDSHPPLFYLWLRVILGAPTLSGNIAWLGHLAAVIPFLIGVVLALTYFRKYFGVWAAAVFIVLDGLSINCIRNNLEIRMYSLVFFFILVALFQGYMILTKKLKSHMAGILSWAVMVAAAVLAGYSHYYGIMVGGLLITFVAFIYFLQIRGKSWIYVAICPVSYVVLYLPWLKTLFKHMEDTKNNFWLTQSESFLNVIKFVFLGERLWKVILVLTIVMSLLVLLFEAGTLKQHRQDGKTRVKFCKVFQIKNPAPELTGLLLCWLLLAVILGVPYILGYVYRPILIARYMYTIVPTVLFVLMLCISYLGKKMKEYFGVRPTTMVSAVLLIVLMIPSLLDAKYFRSETKTQAFQLERITSEIGQPRNDTIFLSRGVQHLGWTVLKYYYPNNEITTVTLGELPDVPEIWSFFPDVLPQEEIDAMTARGYTCDAYTDMHFGRYPCNVYHFTKE